MEVITHSDLSESVLDVVKQHIHAKAQEIAEKYKQQALKELETAVHQAVVETSVHFSKLIEVKDNGVTLTISIRDMRKEALR